MKKNTCLKFQFALRLFLIFGFVLSISSPAWAEEEIGLIPRLWQKLFGKKAVEQPKEPIKKEGVAVTGGPLQVTEHLDEDAKVIDSDIAEEEDYEGETQEELEARQALFGELEQEKRQRILLKDIKQAQEAQQKVQQPPKLPK